MLKFLVFDDGGVAKGFPLDDAYLIGSDNNAIRANISFKDGLIICQKRESGVAAVALLHDAGGCGQLMLQTCLLCEREEPYLLSLELARRRLILFYNKLEDWSMFETGLDKSLLDRFDLARGQFIDALCDQHDDPQRADRLAKDCLVNAIDVGEALSLDRADQLLSRRVASGMVPKFPLGCRVNLSERVEHAGTDLLGGLNFVELSASWQQLVPKQGHCQWGTMDPWVAWLGQHRVPIVGGPIVDFAAANLPDWLTVVQLDYPALRDLVYEHTERVVGRYRNMIRVWNVVSGLHINRQFGLNFEQLMELSRMTTLLVKKIQPASRVLIEIQHPFGEYYAVNQRSIPPLMYADLLMQGAIAFDGFAIKLLMGRSNCGQHARDLMQISHLLDQFAVYGKPVTVVFAVPSGTGSPADVASPPRTANAEAGYWHSPWSESVQGQWLDAVYKIALSKPFVDAVVWDQWLDQSGSAEGETGLIGSQKKPKNAYFVLSQFRKRLDEGQNSLRVASPSRGGPSRAE